MFLKLKDSYTVSLLVTDVNNTRITDDSPHVIIKNVSKNTYWNGIQWVSEEFRIYMEHIINGVYQYTFVPDQADIYEVTAHSDTYNISKVETLEVYSEDLISCDWSVGIDFTIKYPFLHDGKLLPRVKICKDKDKTFWNGSEWNNIEIYNEMLAVDSELVTYNFIPNEESKYYITIIEDDKDLLMVLSAVSESENISPIVVNNNTIKSLDGTDSKVTTDTHSPLPGVKIRVFDITNKELKGQTATDMNGEWSLILKPGKYYFTFEKDGYIPIGLQRVVM